jgi:hypothetical protein
MKRGSKCTFFLKPQRNREMEKEKLKLTVNHYLTYMEQINLYLQSTIDFLVENITIELAFKIVIAYFFVVWIALIVWVIKDISVRTNSIIFQILCVLTILI